MKSIANKLIATFTIGAVGLAAASVFACDGVCCQREPSKDVQWENSVFVVPPLSVRQPQFGIKRPNSISQDQQSAARAGGQFSQQGRGLVPQGQLFIPHSQQFSSEVEGFRGQELPGGPQRQQLAGPQGQGFGPQGQQQFRSQGQGFALQGQQQFRSQGQGLRPQAQQLYGPEGQNQFGPQGQGFRPQGAPIVPQGQPSGPIGPQGLQRQEFAPQGEPNGPQGQQLSSKPSTKGVNPKIAKALAELAPEDRALAERQGICPVTGEPLGLMGTPVKVDVKGRPVFVCCGGCKEDLLAKTNEYLTKLKN